MLSNNQAVLHSWSAPQLGPPATARGVRGPAPDPRPRPGIATAGARARAWAGWAACFAALSNVLRSLTATYLKASRARIVARKAAHHRAKPRTRDPVALTSNWSTLHQIRRPQEAVGLALSVKGAPRPLCRVPICPLGGSCNGLIPVGVEGLRAV